MSNESDKFEPVLHRIRVRLHPVHMGALEGKYFARTASEASQGIEQVCAADMERGGGTGSLDDMIKYVKRFLNETAYQLCDGFTVDFGFFSVHPHIGGVFDSKHEKYDPNKHPINFRFRAHASLKRLTKYIEVEVKGIADSRYIISLVDQESGKINEKLSPGGFFALQGRRIKVVGEDPRVGVYFIPQNAENTKDAKSPDGTVGTDLTMGGIPVKGRLASNRSTKLIGMVPALNAGTYRAAVLTQYVSGTVCLNEPKLVESHFILNVE